jgi:hypothetical protein
MGGRGARLAVPNSYPIYGPDREPARRVVPAPPAPEVEPDDDEPTEAEPTEVPEPEADES